MPETAVISGDRSGVANFQMTEWGRSAGGQGTISEGTLGRGAYNGASGDSRIPSSAAAAELCCETTPAPATRGLVEGGNGGDGLLLKLRLNLLGREVGASRNQIVLLEPPDR